MIILPSVMTETATVTKHVMYWREYLEKIYKRKKNIRTSLATGSIPFSSWKMKKEYESRNIWFNGINYKTFFYLKSKFK